MVKTQLQSLQEANLIYREIARVTELLIRVKAEEQLGLIRERGELIESATTILQNLKSLPLGGTLSAIEAEKELLDDAIMAVVTQDKLSEISIGDERNSVQERMNISISRHRVSHAYKLQSREGE